MANHKNQCCVFLDCLGFSGFVTKNKTSNFAQDILLISNFLLEDRLLDRKIVSENNSKQKPTQECKELQVGISINNIKNFIPMSDSLFITGNIPNKFIEQVSTLIFEAYLFHTRPFYNNNITSLDPAITPEIASCDCGETHKYSKQYLCLYKGGVAYGQADIIPSEALIDSNYSKTFNIIGQAVINAAHLEKVGKGPKLYLDKSFVRRLDDKHRIFIKEEVHPDGDSKHRRYQHFLWTAFLYIKSWNIDTLLIEFKTIINPALHFYKAYKNIKDTKAEIHYKEFVKLLVVGFLKFMEVNHQSSLEIVEQEVTMFLNLHDPALTEYCGLIKKEYKTKLW